MPCKEELPELVDLVQEFRDQGGLVLGVSEDLMAPNVTAESELPKLREFLVEWGMDYPTLLYDEDDTIAMDEHFDLPGPIPVTLALDADGKIVDRHEGPADKARFREMMRKALGR